ncbi:hypothetical protein B7494_g2671 [Chlorociboria aeruginascens]|nr:hypothetical protein B7494_g2671 [Chlorociboria aeruginascens]
MDPSPLPMLKAMLPKLPLIGKITVWHALGLSEHSKHWDLRSELTIKILRSLLTTPHGQPLSKIQNLSVKDPGVKGRIWISKVTMARPEEDDLRQSLFGVIESMKEPGEAPRGFKEPELSSVEAEWTGYRSGATSQSLPLDIPEAQKYTELMREVSKPTTILYFHGGAYYLMDPASHRPTTKKLAKLTGGRCLSVRYRLAPQNPFPAALLDALISYLTLLYPTPGSFHEPVAAHHVVLAGDSAGGNLCLVLIQVLLEFRRQGLKIRWNGEPRDIPLPAGAAMLSSWADVLHSMPSCETNAIYDYLPSRTIQLERMEYPRCHIWPTDPPRRHLYAEDAVLCHPLVSPLAAKSWEGCCPLWIETGQELLSDENKFMATKAASEGVTVVFEEYEAMPHCFAMVLPSLPASRRCFDGWAAFVRDAVKNPENMETRGTRIHAKTLIETPIDLKTLSPLTWEEVITQMRRGVVDMSARNTNAMPKL